MTTRQKYTMTEEQQTTLLDACKPVPYMVVGGVEPRSPQQNANAAWRSLAKDMGFEWDTVQPVFGASSRHFTACPTTEGMVT